MNEEVLLTEEGYKKLVTEHEELVSVRRKEVSERLKEAISYGDLSENAEYDAAKNEQAELEERIMKIESKLRNARVVTNEDVDTDVVNVGLLVKVKDLTTGDDEEFMIVGSGESDPFAEPARITSDSIVGKSLIGRTTGDKVEIPAPAGMLHYQIEDIIK